MNPDLLLNLRKFLVPEIVYGEGAISLSGRHAGNFGASRVLIVTDPGVRRAGWISVIEQSLSENRIDFHIFDNITPNPKDHEVMAGASVYKNKGCDLIIAVGGGSPMDCAKGIAVLVENSGDILDFEGVDAVPNPGPPLIFIPTTAGSSADVSQFAIITDTTRNIKVAIISKMVIPDIALIDPRTTVSMPPQLTAETGMDTLCHAFEAYVSTASSPLTDMAALSAVKIIADHLEAAYHHPDDYHFRDKMMTASLMAGLAFSNASLGLVHAMAHSLGGAKDLPHGECNALLLEKVILFNYDACFEKYDQLAIAMNIPKDDALPGKCSKVLSERIASLRSSLGIHQPLSERGVEKAELGKLAYFAFNDPCLATNPRDAEIKDIEKIFLQAL